MVGDPASAVECLRRAIHFAPSNTRDVGYIGLANILHKQGFLNEAIIVARAALDISGVSVSELCSRELTCGNPIEDLGLQIWCLCLIPRLLSSFSLLTALCMRMRPSTVHGNEASTVHGNEASTAWEQG